MTKSVAQDAWAGSMSGSLTANTWPFPQSRGVFDEPQAAPVPRRAATNPWASHMPKTVAHQASWAAPVSSSVATDAWPFPQSSVAEEARTAQTPRKVVEERDCIICVETKGTASFPVLPVSPSCNHAPETCLDCLQRHIKTAVNEKAWHARVVTCPQCNSAMEYDKVQMYANRATFETYDARVLNDAIAMQSDFFSCPGAGCGSGQIHDAADAAPIVTCIGCRRKYCFRHHVLWHETLSCEEYDRFLADPDGFRSAFDVENERMEREREAEKRLRREQEVFDHRLAQSLLEDKEARAEAEARARTEQAVRAEAERREAEKRAAKQRADAAARAQASKDAKRRVKENNASVALVKRTTKNCPGCGWPIEKNQGW